MKKSVFIILLYVFLASLGRAEKNDVYVELILDASGSMEEVISGKTKMQIAKDVLSKYVQTVNKDYHLGLRVYGNTKKKDCTDTHLIVPMAQNNRGQIISEIKKVTALSMTPIGYSLQKAAEDLAPLKGKGTLGIVLVTDGQESCALDPCKIAQDMIKSGLQLKVNVIGFDIKDQKAHDQLKCIAKATGGTYVTSDTSDSLYKMLEKSVETVALPVWNLRVETPSTHETYYLDVFDEKTGKIVLEHRYANVGYLLPDGVYTVKVDTKPEYIEKNVRLSQDKQTILKVKGFGKLTARVSVEGHETIYMTVKDSAGKEVVKKGYLYSAGYLLPEGSYTVEFSTSRGRLLWTKKDVEIKLNQTTEVQMAGFGKLVARSSVDGHEGIYISAKDSAGKEVIERGYLYSAGYVLPEGRYTVELSIGKGGVPWTKKEDVQIRPDKTTEIQLKGFGKLIAKEPNSKESFYLTVKDSKGEMLVDRGIPYSMGYILPIGTYTVELGTRRGSAAWIKKDVEIGENKTTKVYFDQEPK